VCHNEGLDNSQPVLAAGFRGHPGVAGFGGAASKITPIRFCWIHTILHSWIEESLAITRRKQAGTKAGFSTSMAAPSGEIFRTMQLMIDPADDT
jgi:hypothetical protein